MLLSGGLFYIDKLHRGLAVTVRCRSTQRETEDLQDLTKRHGIYKSIQTGESQAIIKTEDE